MILTIVAAAVEVVSIGAVIPFLGVLAAPEIVFQSLLVQPLIQFLGLTQSNQLILPVTIVFIILVIFSGLVRLVLLYIVTKLSYTIGSELSVEIYRRTLYQKYAVHIERNSSEVIDGIITKTSMIIGHVIHPVFTLISSLVILFSILILLVVIHPEVTFVLISILFAFYLIVIIYTKKKVRENSVLVASNSTQMVKSLQEGLGGIRDVLIEGNQEYYCKLYKKSDFNFRNALASTIIISGSPRFAMEMVGMSLIATFAFIMSSSQEGLNSVIPVLGLFALAAQKVLPLMQLAYSAYSNINGSKASIVDVLKFLAQPVDNINNMANSSYNKNIEIKDLNFRYKSDTPWILKNVNITIAKGARVGFIGETGSGKSTLLDIVMGLLPPTSGSISIDGKIINDRSNLAWRKRIAHVPQYIYLTDDTIVSNIAFGISKNEIDYNKIQSAAKIAQIHELINTWKDGYQTIVGERGVKLSGGQRQRIGIARALYKKSDVLILDEATSALDNITEQKVMNGIDSLNQNLTILIIAHRVSTLNNCDTIVKLHRNNKITISDNKR